nr:hypothetical protein [Brevundimonas diminuta]
MTTDLSALIARLEAAETTGIIMESEAVALQNALGLEDSYDTDWKQCCWNALKGSLDAAIGLAEAALPGWPCWGVATDIPGRIGAVLAKSNRDEGVMGYAATPALALCIATLRAKLDGYAAEGEVNKTPKAQEG